MHEIWEAERLQAVLPFTHNRLSLADEGEHLAYLLQLLLALFLPFFFVLGQVCVQLGNKGCQLLPHITCVIKTGGHKKQTQSTVYWYMSDNQLCRCSSKVNLG